MWRLAMATIEAQAVRTEKWQHEHVSIHVAEQVRQSCPYDAVQRSAHCQFRVTFSSLPLSTDSIGRGWRQ